MKNSDVQQILDAWRENRKHRNVRFYLWWLVVVIGSLITFFLSKSSIIWIRSLSLLTFLLMMLATAWLLLIGQKKAKSLLACVAESKDTRLVGLLAEALDPWEAELSVMSASVLADILPHLNQSDIELTTHQRLNLYKALNKDDLQLNLALLKFIRKLGDIQAIPYVMRLAKKHADTDIGQKVKLEAYQCLQVLQANKEQNVNSQLLLRSSENDDSHTLMRADKSEIDSATDELLRPNSSDDLNS